MIESIYLSESNVSDKEHCPFSSEDAHARFDWAVLEFHVWPQLLSQDRGRFLLKSDLLHA